jgi:hypothetical protein
MGNVLKCNLAVGNKQIDASGAQGIADDLGHVAGNAKRAHRRSLVKVGHQHRVLTRRDDDVPVGDWLDVHESDDGVVLVDKGGRRIATQDLAKHALVSHRAVRSLKR